jgi:hypothetical protein
MLQRCTLLMQILWQSEPLFRYFFQVPEAAMEFRVIWEIDIEAEGPKEAAQQAREIQLIPGMSGTVFDVWAYAAGKMHRIDLVEEPDRLNRDELFAITAGLRLLLCDPDTSASIRELATVVLICLGRDNMILNRMDRGLERRNPVSLTLRQVLCKCTLTSVGDLWGLKCSRGHRGLVCGDCARLGRLVSCPVCNCPLVVEGPLDNA